MSRSSEERDPLDEIAEEFLERYREGERLVIGEFASRVPGREEEARELLSALLMVERLKPQESLAVEDTGPHAVRGVLPDLERLGDFRIVREIGRGGMGVVYEAEQMSLGRCVALKVLSTAPGRTPQQVQRFMREARAAAQLHHSNIVPVFGVGEQDGNFFYAMQYIQGHGLDKVMEEVQRQRRGAKKGSSGDVERALAGRDEPSVAEVTRTLLSRGEGEAGGSGLSTTADWRPGKSLAGGLESDAHYEREVARIGLQVAEALDYAHRQGTLHRDIKPSNLLLDGSGTVWVTDLGLAKASEDDDITRTGDLVGTLRYMAPERFRGECDARSDVYSLGLTLFELVALRPPFDAIGRERLIYDVVHRQPPRLSSLCPKVSRDFETIVHKAIEKEPSHRYSSAAEMALDLRSFLENRPIRSRRVGSTERLTRWARRNPGLATLGTVVGGLLGLVVLVIAVADVRLRKEHEIALSHLARAKRAESDAVSKLLDSTLAQARAGRRGGMAGRRFEGLASLGEVARLPAGRARLIEFRNEAIACLALADLRIDAEWDDRSEDGYLGFDFDPGCGRVARGRPGGEIMIHEGFEPVPRQVLPGNGSRAVLVRFSPDGRYLAVKHEEGQRVELIVWDVEERRRILALADGIHASAVDFHPDSRHLVLGRRDGSLNIHALPEGKVVGQMSPITVPHLLRFDATGRRLAVVSPVSDESVVVRAFPGGERLASWREPEGAYAVDWDPAGKWLAAAGVDGRIHLLDPGQPEKAAGIMEGHTGQCVSLAVHPDGKLLASASWDGTVRVWDTVGARELLRSPVTHARGLRFSRDGKRLGPGSDGDRSFVWELAEGKELRTLGEIAGWSSPSWSVDFLDRYGLLVSSSAGGVRLEKLDGTVAPAFLALPGTRDVAIDRSGEMIYTSGGVGVQRWPLRRLGDGTLKVGPPVALEGRVGQSTGRLALSRDGRRLAIVVDEERGAAIVVDVANPADGVRIAGHRNMERVALSPDGRWLATGTWKGDGVKIWDTSDGSLVRDLPVRGSANGCFSPDGRQLVTGSGEEYVLWDTEAWGVIRRFPRAFSGGLPGHAAFRADGVVVALARTRTNIELFDLRRGVELATLEDSEPQNVSGVGFTLDGQRLAVVSNAPEIRCWDLAAIREGLAEAGLDWEGKEQAAIVRQGREGITGLKIEPPAWLMAFEQGEEATRAGRWDEAISAYRESVAKGDAGAEVWTRMALVHLMKGDQALYRDVCRHLIEKFGGRDLSPLTANNLAWGCALGPGGLDDYDTAIRMARFAATSRPETNRLNTLGAVLLRAGRTEEAIEQLKKSVASHGAGGTPYDALFLALAHQRLGQEKEARAWLGRASQPTPLAMRKPDDSYPSYWVPRLEIELLRREATALIGLDGEGADRK